MSTKTRKPPAVSDGLFKQALHLHQQGNLHEAERLYRQVLKHNAHHSDCLHLLGMIGYQCGHPESAVELISQAISLNAGEALYHSNLGVVMNSLGKLDEAINSYQRAVELRPAYTEAHSNLASVLVKKGEFTSAVAHFQQVLTLHPDNAEAHLNLGVALAEMGDPAQAIPYYQRAIELKPDFAVAFSNLGNALKELGKLNEAVASFNQALTLQPNYLTALYNLGNTYQALNKLDDALNTYTRARLIQPDYTEAIYGTSLAQLLDGNFVDGWQNYESRWKMPGHKPLRQYPFPLWKGNNLGTGQLLLWGEQGVGDEIMFASLIPDLLRTGNRCILDCDARLAPLFARSFPGLQVVSGLPDVHIAAHLPTGSLPRFFRNTEAAFLSATSPYLVADRIRCNQFRTRYAWGKRIVGIAWHTNNQKTGRPRSMALEQLAPLLRRTDIVWVSLQYGDLADLEKQSSAAQVPLFIDHEVNQLADLDLFAAQVAAMDLVITIDNSTAHLAGALGVPVWLMLPFERDWRWQHTRPDTPWYPTMRLFRQPQPADWPSVVNTITTLIGANTLKHNIS